MKRPLRRILWLFGVALLLGLAVVLCFCWSSPSTDEWSYEDLSSDPKVLHIVFPGEDRTYVTCSLHPVDAPSTYVEYEVSHKITHFNLSVADVTPTAYRVNFQRIITESGIAKASSREVVDFPFGHRTEARLFASKNLIGFYGNPAKKRP
ncbi:MAG: hypothetical protein HZA91_20590 [Verrucomicrobia bacterium]|nr:hypothetical protein [Verrucomicrobiota bacterium]